MTIAQVIRFPPSRALLSPFGARRAGASGTPAGMKLVALQRRRGSHHGRAGVQRQSRKRDREDWSRLALRVCDRPPADVGAAEAPRPVDQANGLVGSLLCLGDRLAARSDVEDAPAVGEETIALPSGAGMKN